MKVANASVTIKTAAGAAVANDTAECREALSTAGIARGIAVLTVPLVAEYGWTAYTPLTGSEIPPWPDAWAWTSTGVSVAAVVACGLTAAYLGRRRT